jgi:hypothetical protein
MNVWVLRAVWVSLPVTAGTAVADAIGPWASAPRATAAVLAWILWTVVLVALLIPRPVTLTVARLGTPLAVVGALLAAFTGRPDAPAAAVAIVLTVFVTVFATRGEFARVCAQRAAYGDEDRFPLRLPIGVGALALPVAVAVVGTTLGLGPLLLAAELWLAGGLVILLGLPVTVVMVRLVHQLSMRWVVLVPAGLVVADPLTLTDPVLFVRERILGLGPADPSRRPPPEALDLRLGAAYGSCALLLSDEATLMRQVRGRGVGARANLLLVTPTCAPRLLERAEARRIPVRRD